MKKQIILFCLAFIIVELTNAQFTKSGFVDGSGNSGSPMVTAPLHYDGYEDSEKGFGIELTKLESVINLPSVYSITDSKTEFSEGSYYFSFLINVQKPFIENRAYDFIYLSPNYNGTRGRGRIYFYGTDSIEGNYKIGIKDNPYDSETNFPINYAENMLQTDSTYLIVLKTDVGDFSKDLNLYINPGISSNEPELPTVSCIRTLNNPLTYIRGLCVNQSNVANIIVSGIRFADNFADAVGYSNPVSAKINNKINYKVYPNPCDNKIYINYPGLNKVNISISDLQGRLLKTQKINSGEPVNTTDLNSGYYLLNVSDGELVTKRMKFIKK